ncbi:MAG: putative phage tail protein [Clostridia bacterium]
MWTDKTIDLSRKVPDFFSGIYEYQQLFSVLNNELIYLQQEMHLLKDDLFLNTARENIISRYQNLLKTSGSTLEQKRANIISKFSETVPFSIDSLHNIIKRYISVGYEIDLATDGKIIVYYKGGSFLQDKTLLYRDVYNIIPANLLFELEYLFLMYSDYLLNFYEDFTKKTWYELTLGA